jgi:hypothetical protein
MVESTAPINCSDWTSPFVVQGTLICKGSVDSTTLDSTNSSETNTSSTSSSASPTSSPPGSTKSTTPKLSSGLSPGAIAGIAIAAVVVLVIVGLLFWARKKGYKLSPGFAKLEADTGVPHPGIPELPRGGHHEQAEMAAVERPSELTVSRLNGPVFSETFEMPAHPTESHYS